VSKNFFCFSSTHSRRVALAWIQCATVCADYGVDVGYTAHAAHVAHACFAARCARARSVPMTRWHAGVGVDIDARATGRPGDRARADAAHGAASSNQGRRRHRRGLPVADAWR